MQEARTTDGVEFDLKIARRRFLPEPGEFFLANLWYAGCSG